MGKSSIPYSDFGRLNTTEQLMYYFDNRAYEHTNYYHYTTLNTINSILKNKQFWISCVDGFNDKCDSRQFKGMEREYYSLCFSTGVNENLPLWYLYSGLDGKGGRLRLTPSKIKELIQEGVYTLYEKDGKDIRKDTGMQLISGITMKREFRDVLYLRQNDSISLKYNTMTNYNFNSAEYDSIKSRWNHFIKGLIWYYEKETRLLVHLTGDAQKIIKENPDKTYIITLSFDEKLDNHIKIDFAPEIDSIEETIKLDEFAHIKEHLFKTSKVRLSDYHGEVKMNLCRNCNKQ